MTLLLIRDLTEMSTRNLHGDKARPAQKAILALALRLSRDLTEMSTGIFMGISAACAKG
jgi:hypothetical protein